jgi:hypothetical protein
VLRCALMYGGQECTFHCTVVGVLCNTRHASSPHITENVHVLEAHGNSPVITADSGKQ